MTKNNINTNTTTTKGKTVFGKVKGNIGIKTEKFIQKTTGKINIQSKLCKITIVEK